jgi:hypothetical protein
MKTNFLAAIAISLTLISCEKPEIKEYEYEKNPAYSWGYAEFWGPYYAEYSNNNHVVSLSLFTDSLDINQESKLTGFGQYLYLEDIFIAPSDTLMPAGVYEVNDSGNAFTVAVGEQIDYDGDKFDVGAMIFFVEKNSNNDIRKFITGGKMTVFQIGDKTLITCDFKLDDGTELKGRYEALLPYFDQSEESAGVRQKSRRKIRQI